MQYDELFSHYHELVSQLMTLQNQLSELPEGYISEKTISGRSYFYLQKRIMGKMQSRYIPAEQLSEIRQALSSRKQLESDRISLSRDIDALEQAAKLLNDNLLRRMIQHKRCSQMDQLPISTRKNSLSFANAIVALEGINPQADAVNNLKAWSEGRKSFTAGYQAVLRRYNLDAGTSR